jgi:acyl carrier protein
MIDEARLREILEDELGCDLTGVRADTLLFSSGIVDSFALVTLMMTLEKEAGFRVNPGDVVLENFDSIDRILAYVSRNAA